MEQPYIVITYPEVDNKPYEFIPCDCGDLYHCFECSMRHQKNILAAGADMFEDPGL